MNAAQEHENFDSVTKVTFHSLFWKFSVLSSQNSRLSTDSRKSICRLREMACDLLNGLPIVISRSITDALFLQDFQSYDLPFLKYVFVRSL